MGGNSLRQSGSRQALTTRDCTQTRLYTMKRHHIDGTNTPHNMRCSFPPSNAQPPPFPPISISPPLSPCFLFEQCVAPDHCSCYPLFRSVLCWPEWPESGLDWLMCSRVRKGSGGGLRAAPAKSSDPFKLFPVREEGTTWRDLKTFTSKMVQDKARIRP